MKKHTIFILGLCLCLIAFFAGFTGKAQAASTTSYQDVSLSDEPVQLSFEHIDGRGLILCAPPVIASDAEFKHLLNSEISNMGNAIQAEIIDEPISEIFVQIPKILADKSVGNVSISLSYNNLIMPLNNTNWFTITNISVRQNEVTNSGYEAVISFVPNTEDIFPCNPVLVTESTSIAGLFGLTFDENLVCISGEFIFPLGVYDEAVANQIVTGSILTISDALEEIATSDIIVSCNNKNIAVIAE